MMTLVSLIIATMALSAFPAWRWWHLWRERRSPAAGALVLTNVLLILIGASRLFELAIGKDLSVEVWLLALLMSAVQFALAAGYFSGERDGWRKK